MYPFTDYEARNEDGTVASTIGVYRVTEDHDGERVLTTGGPQDIHTGDVLVASANPNYVDVFSADVFDGLGYAEPNSSAPAAPVAEPVAADAPVDENAPLDVTTPGA